MIPFARLSQILPRETSKPQSVVDTIRQAPEWRIRVGCLQTFRPRLLTSRLLPTGVPILWPGYGLGIAPDDRMHAGAEAVATIIETWNRLLRPVPETLLPWGPIAGHVQGPELRMMMGSAGQ